MDIFAGVLSICILILALWYSFRHGQVKVVRETFVEALPERLPKIRLNVKYQVLLGLEVLKFISTDSNETFVIPRVVIITDIDEMTGMLYMVKVDAEMNANTPNGMKEGWVHPSQFSALILYEEPKPII